MTTIKDAEAVVSVARAIFVRHAHSTSPRAAFERAEAFVRESHAWQRRAVNLDLRGQLDDDRR